MLNIKECSNISIDRKVLLKINDRNPLMMRTCVNDRRKCRYHKTTTTRKVSLLCFKRISILAFD